MKNIKMAPKLIGGFLIVALIALTIGLVGLSAIRELGEVRLPSIESLLIISEGQTAIDSAENALLCLELTPQMRQDEYQAFEEARKRINEAWAIYEPLPQTAEEASVWNEFVPAWNAWIKDHEAYVELARAWESNKSDAGYMRMVEQALHTNRASFAESETLLLRLVHINEVAADEAAAGSRVMMLTAMIIGFLVAVGLGLFLTLSITKPMTKMAEAADKVAIGDLNQNIDYESKDEIGIVANSFRTVIAALRSLMIDDGGAALKAAANKNLTARVKSDYQGVYGEMKDNINSLLEAMEEGMSQVAEGSAKVRSASQEIATSSQDVGKASQSIAETIGQVAAGSTEQSKIVATSSASMEQLAQAIEEVSKGAQSQAQTVEETVSLVQQITAAIESVAKTAQQAAGSSLEVSEVAKSGGENVEKSVHGMARIKDATGNVAGAIGQLGENSKQIGAIVETIDDIAEQTNLLALNAAIEAARAGEHGKGFAVVADEVRKLAERSSKATKEIADLIGQIQQMTDHAVKAMEEGQTEVETGTELANQAGEALSGIQEAVNGIVRQIEEMSAATQQMSASSSEVVRAVESVSAITEQSTAATEEMAASSSEVTKSVEQVAAVSEQNAASAEEVSAAAEEQNASVEEMSASAEEMARIAEELQTLVNQFKISEGGSSSDVRIADAKPTSQTIRKAA